MKIETTYTGGGCHGLRTKYKGKVVYLSTIPELDYPCDGDTVSVGIYDKKFEDQLACATIKKFKLKNIEEYVKKYLAMYERKSKNRKRKGQNDILYLN